jgi:hypothetical protein
MHVRKEAEDEQDDMEGFGTPWECDHGDWTLADEEKLDRVKVQDGGDMHHAAGCKAEATQPRAKNNKARATTEPTEAKCAIAESLEVDTQISFYLEQMAMAREEMIASKLKFEG